MRSFVPGDDEDIEELKRIVGEPALGVDVDNRLRGQKAKGCV